MQLSRYAVKTAAISGHVQNGLGLTGNSELTANASGKICRQQREKVASDRLFWNRKVSKSAATAYTAASHCNYVLIANAWQEHIDGGDAQWKRQWAKVIGCLTVDPPDLAMGDMF